jgi:two-component system chemotaxis response regulator CheB
LSNAPLRVLVCDDSAVARAAVVRMLEADPALRVASRARNGKEAVEAVRAGGLDVAVLDLEMPVMDGLTALPLMLEADPALRVIVASTLTQRGAAAAMEAMRRGAVDCLAKPAPGEDAIFAAELVARAKGFGALRRRGSKEPGPGAPSPAPVQRLPPPPVALRDKETFPAPSANAPALLAIGSSTGGPEALATVFRAIRRPPRIPILVTQHMPDAFIHMLAEHLGRLGACPVSVAKDGDAILAGRALLAPGGHHLLVGAGPKVVLSDGPPEHFCRPAVDPMLRSVAAVFGGRAAAVVLTGMGHDGGAGSLELRRAGGFVAVQDQATSVVWGMPGSVVERGAANEVLPLQLLAERIADLAGAA